MAERMSVADTSSPSGGACSDDLDRKPAARRVNVDPLSDASPSIDATRLLDEAMQSLPVSDTDAYFKAKRLCPKLVVHKNPSYLKFNSNNVWAASKMVSAYWAKRVNLFGDKAFLPLSLRQDGGPTALGPAERAIVNLGVSVQLPRDSKGRKVACFDKARYSHHHTQSEYEVQDKVRAMFFYMTAQSFPGSEADVDSSDAVCHPNQDTSEVVLLVRALTEMSGAGRFDRRVARSMYDLMSVAPLKIVEIHLVCNTDSRQSSGWLRTILPIAIQRTTQYFLNLFEKKLDLQVLVGKSSDDVRGQLEARGFTAEGLPTTLGGTWTYEREWADWQYRHGLRRPQSKIADSLRSDGHARDLVDRAPSRNNPSPLEVLGRAAVAQHSAQEAVPDDTAAAILSSPPEGESSLVSGDGDSTSRASGKRKLEDSAGKDSDEDAMGIEEERKLRRRRLNVIYSRRKRAKQKKRCSNLYQVFNELRVVNSELKADEQKLLALLIQAKDIVRTYEQERIKRVQEMLRDKVAARRGPQVPIHRQVSLNLRAASLVRDPTVHPLQLQSPQLRLAVLEQQHALHRRMEDLAAQRLDALGYVGQRALSALPQMESLRQTSPRLAFNPLASRPFVGADETRPGMDRLAASPPSQAHSAATSGGQATQLSRASVGAPQHTWSAFDLLRFFRR